MASRNQRTEHVVFGLDIGTRSVVGTVGYMKDEKFYVMAQRVRLHETRAMLDGQIHDIGKVSATIRGLKLDLERETDIELVDVCIAAAGRVLRTVEASYEEEYPDGGHTITDEDIYHLNSRAVEKAYRTFIEENESGMKFFLVGYTTMHYYLNGYQIANLEGHNAGTVSADVIATFLPEDVADGLYKSCERAGLQVVNMTLEPIAAIRVAIPERFRMLNLALIDVGAGTSDICVTNDGTITAYGMLPIAGDSLTELIARHCLVDFNAADHIKIEASEKDKVVFTDIMGLEKSITAKEIQKLTKPLIDSMAEKTTNLIKELNGGNPVSAVFVVGGGGRIPGYTKAVSDRMGIPDERVALRGEEVMKDIVFLKDSGISRDSLLVTPLGICISFYEEANNFVLVSFNGEQTKLYDNGKLAIVDAAMQAEFPNEDLFPKRGEALSFRLNEQERVVRGQPGEPATITLNGAPADIHTKIHANDIIQVKPSTAGEAGSASLAALPEFNGKFKISVNGQEIEATRVATVNGENRSAWYEIRPNDNVTILDYNTARQVAALMDIALTEDTVITVNNEPANADTPVYENFKVEFRSREEALMDSYREPPEEADEPEETFDTPPQEPEVRRAAPTRMMHVTVNEQPITMQGKSEYVFVDIFDYIDFDLSQANGRAIVTLLNGGSPDYMQTLKEGDRIEVYWKAGKA